MSHPLPRRLRRPVATLAATPLLLAVAGCGASLEAQTYAPRTMVDATNASLGDLEVRNLRVEPPSGGIALQEGSDAPVTLVLTNRGPQDDVLVSATSPDADEVVLLTDGAPSQITVPARGSTQGSASLILRGLTSELLAGEYVEMTLRFEQAGAVEALVPVATTGRTTREVFTGEPGSEEGEPALQAPTGGYGEKKGAEGTEAEGTGAEGTEAG